MGEGEGGVQGIAAREASVRDDDQDLRCLTDGDD